MARCPLKGARKSVMCPLRNIFIILGNERLTEVYQNERPDGAHNSIPVPFGAAQRPVQKFCHRSACASLSQRRQVRHMSSHSKAESGGGKTPEIKVWDGKADGLLTAAGPIDIYPVPG